MDHQQWLEQHELAIAAHERWLEEQRQSIARHEHRLEEQHQWREENERQRERLNAEHERKMQILDEKIRRAVRLAVAEERAERRKRRELDEKIAQLAAAQLVTEEKHQLLQEEFRKWLERDNRRYGGNGDSPAAG